MLRKRKKHKDTMFAIIYSEEQKGKAMEEKKCLRGVE
jgi:hypothetical protein